MNPLSLEFGGAEATLASLRSARSQLAGELQRLEAAAQALSGGWTGDAQQAYATAQREWSMSMHELAAILEAACEILSAWIDGMHETEHRLAQAWPA